MHALQHRCMRLLGAKSGSIQFETGNIRFKIGGIRFESDSIRIHYVKIDLCKFHRTEIGQHQDHPAGRMGTEQRLCTAGAVSEKCCQFHGEGRKIQQHEIGCSRGGG